MKFYQLVLKILSGNEILTSFKGHNSVGNVRKMICYNPNLDLLNINAYTNIGKIRSICSQDIEWKPNYGRQNDETTDGMMDRMTDIPNPV